MTTRKLPRDLYAGVIAGELMERGYFGKETQYFGCIYRQGSETLCEISSDAEKIYHTAARLFYQGGVISPVMSFSRRSDLKDVAAKQAIREELERELRQTFPEDLLGLLTCLSEMPDRNKALPLLKSFRDTLDVVREPQRRRGFVGLVRQARLSKTLDAVQEKALLDNLPAPVLAEALGDARVCNFSGFAYLDKTSHWQFYMNAYLPAVIEKKVRLMQQRAATTPTFTQHYALTNDYLNSIHNIRSDFEGLLRKIFDDGYREAVQALQSLPSAIDGQMDKQKVEDIEKKLPRQGKALLQAYLFRWHG